MDSTISTEIRSTGWDLVRALVPLNPPPNGGLLKRVFFGRSRGHRADQPRAIHWAAGELQERSQLAERASDEPGGSGIRFGVRPERPACADGAAAPGGGGGGGGAEPGFDVDGGHDQAGDGLCGRCSAAVLAIGPVGRGESRRCGISCRSRSRPGDRGEEAAGGGSRDRRARGEDRRKVDPRIAQHPSRELMDVIEPSFG
jgi:hypothetical protein